MIHHSRRPGLLACSQSAAGIQQNALSVQRAEAYKGFLARMSNDYAADCAVGNDENDTIDFLDEDEDAFSPKLATNPWKILIADDDLNVHETTLLALNGIRIHGRPLEFLHAYSAKEAQHVLHDHADIALVLLDVVMETVDAGLKLVSLIRNELGRRNLRIVLRTGQPGYAPEQQVSHEFAIDGYTTKSKLTRSILISVLNDTLSNTYTHKEMPN
ncbi:MAG: hypothetical protein KGM99_06760 [Burkholderiales bacterium]|nr:hypothetical protein [Burkholderiales bacterium]